MKDAEGTVYNGIQIRIDFAPEMLQLTDKFNWSVHSAHLPARKHVLTRKRPLPASLHIDKLIDFISILSFIIIK